MFVVDDLLLWLPGKALVWVFKELYNHVMAEWRDPNTIRQQLLELQLLYEMDEMSLEEYELRETQLLMRLRQAAEVEYSAAEGGEDDSD